MTRYMHVMIYEIAHDDGQPMRAQINNNKNDNIARDRSQPTASYRRHRNSPINDFTMSNEGTNLSYILGRVVNVF